MKFDSRSQIKKASSLLSRAVMGMLLLCATAHATTINVRVDTSSLISNSGAPFSLFFQFNDGGVLRNNTVTVDNFKYFGGHAEDMPIELGGVMGDINSSLVFDNSEFHQEVFQAFTPGKFLTFDVSLTTNVDGNTPDAFAFGILDKDLFNIPTTSIFGDDALLVVNLNGASPSVEAFRGMGDYSAVEAAVPEPATWVLLSSVLPLLILGTRRKRRAE